ncbi:MAG TPA: carboxypeptidase-like regulatory domain-containing protein [Planctomycetota bacterium]|nr:carboxypeptidase-like regulatory domain-containing protein [Planctomycetota bacterium]
MNSRAIRLILLVACGLLLARAYFVLAPAPKRTVDVESSRELRPPEAAKVDAPARLDAATHESEESRRVVQEVQDVPVEIAETERTAPLAGRIRVSAVDAQTGAPLLGIRVRAASAARVADRTSDRNGSAIELTLTPDTYALLVLARGYEPAELPPIQVARDQTVTLDPVPLRAGGARILGVVTGDLRPGDLPWVELSGEGRSPCADCAPTADTPHATRCTVCGYAAQSSRRRIPPSGVFSFERLACGPYAIRLIDARERTIGLAKRLDLRAEEALPVELEFVAPRAVGVELIDTDGRSLASEWAARVRAAAAAADDDGSEIVFVESSKPSTEFHCVFRLGDRRLVQSDFTPPPPPSLTAGTSIGVAAFSSRKLSSGARKELDDRPRRSSETLRIEPRVPSLEPDTVAVDVDAEGFVVFDPVPSFTLTLEMRCGPFTATAPVPASAATTLVRARLRRASDPEEGDGTFLEFEAGHSR